MTQAEPEKHIINYFGSVNLYIDVPSALSGEVVRSLS